MLKRFGNIILLLLVAVNAVAESFTIGDYQYTTLSDPTTVSVIVFQNQSTIKSISIPEEVTYNNVKYTVTVIGNNAFYECSKVTDISLPSTITTIRVSAFYKCQKITSITIPSLVNDISYAAFEYTGELKTILFEGVTAPSLTKKLSHIRLDLDLHVLSTAAKESFESNSNWTNSLHAITVDGVSIAEGTNNATTLEKHSGHTADVELTRTINAGGYNSLCLPFAVNAELVEAVFGSDCDIQELTSATIDAGGIDLQFTKRTAMAAGRPYLVKPAATVSNPTFTNVVLTNEVSSTQTTDVDFIGIFSPTDMEASENTLVMGSGSTLHPTAAGTMPGLRGYFLLKTSGAKTAAKKQIRTHFGTTDAATSVENSCTPMENNAHKRLVNGQLHIIRNGVHYNAQGAIIE